MIWPALWVWVALGAALAQAVRFVLQKQMTGAGLSAAGATFARFAFAAPIAAALVLGYGAASGQPLPQGSARFAVFAATGALAQIVATMAVLAVFRARNFAVGITLKNTEVLLAAAVGFALLGDRVTPVAIGAMGLGVSGVVLLSPGAGAVRVFNRAAALGLWAGALFAVSGVAYRGAALALEAGDALLRAGATLACVTWIQTVVMSVAFALFDRAQLGAVLRHWRASGAVALASLLGSLGWFTAFTLQNAALVKAVGQVELIFSLIASWVIFSERVTQRELLGIGVIALSVLMLILWG